MECTCRINYGICRCKGLKWYLLASKQHRRKWKWLNISCLLYCFIWYYADCSLKSFLLQINFCEKSPLCTKRNVKMLIHTRLIIILQVTPQSAHPWHVVSGFKLARADLVSGTLPIRLPSDSGHIYISILMFLTWNHFLINSCQVSL